MVIKALKRALKYGRAHAPVRVCRNRIPVCSVGSSSAAIVGGLAADCLGWTRAAAGYDPGHPQWLPEELLQLATDGGPP